jgi:hypothetical protein
MQNTVTPNPERGTVNPELEPEHELGTRNPEPGTV